MINWEQEAWHWCTSLSCGIAWADHWQTMITGVLAVGAAVLASKVAKAQLDAAKAQIAVARDQIEAEQTAREVHRSARLRAARASLPATLSAVCDYAQEAAAELNNAWPILEQQYPADVRAGQRYMIRANVPIFPLQLVSDLERMVELTSVEAVSQMIEGLMREVQVLAARSRPLVIGELMTARYLAGMLLQAAAVYARAGSIFEYARRQRDDVDPTPLWDSVHSAIRILGVDRPLVVAIAAEERANGQDPGEADTLPA